MGRGVGIFLPALKPSHQIGEHDGNHKQEHHDPSAGHFVICIEENFDDFIHIISP